MAACLSIFAAMLIIYGNHHYLTGLNPFMESVLWSILSVVIIFNLFLLRILKWHRRLFTLFLVCLVVPIIYVVYYWIRL